MVNHHRWFMFSTCWSFHPAWFTKTSDTSSRINSCSCDSEPRMPSQLFGNAWESHWLPTAAFRRIPCSLATQNWLWPIPSILQSPIHIKHFHSIISMIPNYVISYSTRPWFLGVLNVKFHPPLTLECLGGRNFWKIFRLTTWHIPPSMCFFGFQKGWGSSGCHVLA